MTNPTIFNQLIVWPITNLLMVFYKPLLVLGVSGALGFSIVLLTVFIRLILYPLNLKQLRSAQEMQKLKPKIDVLAKKYKNNKKKLQQEQLKLYQKHGINPAAGCLPTLLQFPILIGLYRVFLQLLGNGNVDGITEQINKIVYIPQLKIAQFDVDFFGISLGANPSQWQKYGIWLLAIPVITAGISYYQARTMQLKEAQSSQPKADPPLAEKLKAQNKKKDEKKDRKGGEEDFAGAMQTQMKYLFPLMIGWISFRFPLGLTLYWNTFSLFGIIQQLQVKRGVVTRNT